MPPGLLRDRPVVTWRENAIARVEEVRDGAAHAGVAAAAVGVVERRLAQAGGRGRWVAIIGIAVY